MLYRSAKGRMGDADEKKKMSGAPWLKPEKPLATMMAHTPRPQRDHEAQPEYAALT